MESIGVSTVRAPRRIGRLAAGLLGTGWLVAVAFGFVAMARYGATPGKGGQPPRVWPTNDAIHLDPALPTLLFFAHPQCGCTPASLAELDRVLANARGRLTVHVLFYSDPALGADWVRSAVWDRAAAIPGVRLHTDVLGRTARVFGAWTSGTVVLYGPNGALRFHGGLTSARGHEGESAGANSIAEVLAGGAATMPATEVYGCALIETEPGPR